MNEHATPLCCICGDENNLPTKFVRIGIWTLAFCEQDYMMSKQLLSNFKNIREILHMAGIHIGVPSGAVIKRNTP